MDAMRRQMALHAAEVFDAWRIIPRVFLAVCLAGAAWVTGYLIIWYCTLPATDQGYQATGFAAVALKFVFDFLNKVYDSYSINGRNWNQAPSSTTVSTLSTSSTVVPPT